MNGFMKNMDLFIHKLRWYWQSYFVKKSCITNTDGSPPKNLPQRSPMLYWQWELPKNCWCVCNLFIVQCFPINGTNNKNMFNIFLGVLRIKTISSSNRHHSFSHYVNGFSHWHTVHPKPSCSPVNGCVVPHSPVPFGIRTIRPLTNKPQDIWCLGLALGWPVDRCR